MLHSTEEQWTLINVVIKKQFQLLLIMHLTFIFDKYLLICLMQRGTVLCTGDIEVVLLSRGLLCGEGSRLGGRLDFNALLRISRGVSRLMAGTLLNYLEKTFDRSDVRMKPG